MVRTPALDYVAVATDGGTQPPLHTVLVALDRPPRASDRTGNEGHMSGPRPPRCRVCLGAELRADGRCPFGCNPALAAPKARARHLEAKLSQRARAGAIDEANLVLSEEEATAGARRAVPASYLDGAEKCCRCRRCERVIPDGWLTWICDACKPAQDADEAKHRAKWEARRAEEDAAREASLAPALNREAALVLEALMSEISEDCICARWELGLEFRLWAMVQGGARHFGMSEVSEEDVARLRNLSTSAGGWWRYDRFVPAVEWAFVYAQGPR